MVKSVKGPFRITAAAVVAASVLVLGASGQEAPDSPSLFGEVIDVRVVNLEVVVTRDGKRLTGVGPEEFVLTVDGKEVPIEFFTEVSEGTAVAPGGEKASSMVPALQAGAPVSTSFLVFIDDYFTLGARRNRVLRRLIDQLPALQPVDRMAIVAFDGRGLEMLSWWSQSVPELRQVLEKALEAPARGARTFSERELHNVQEAEIPAPSSETEEIFNSDVVEGTQVITPLPTIAEEQAIGIREQQVKRVVAAATSSLRGFANPPGRKVLLLISGGWPYSPADTVVTDSRQSIYTNRFKYGDTLYGPLIETANRLSYTIYPVNAPFDAESSQNIDAALRLIARDTGGRALLYQDTVSALDEVVADTRSYYWLGFTPDWKGDDESHRINVRARDKGFKVRSRKSFADFSRQEEVTMIVESTLLLGDAPSAGTAMPVAVGELKKVGRHKVEVPVKVLVPMQALTFVPYETRYIAQAELRVAVQDASGTMQGSPVVPLTITLDRPPAKGEMRRWETSLTLRDEPHDLVLSIYDIASGTILASKLTVDASLARAR